MGNVVCGGSFPSNIKVHHMVEVHHMSVRRAPTPPRSPSPIITPHLEPVSPSILQTFMKVEQAWGTGLAQSVVHRRSVALRFGGPRAYATKAQQNTGGLYKANIRVCGLRRAPNGLRQKILLKKNFFKSQKSLRILEYLSSEKTSILALKKTHLVDFV